MTQSQQQNKRWPYFLAFVTSGGAAALSMWLFTQAFDWWHWRGEINGNLVSINDTLQRVAIQQEVTLNKIDKLNVDFRVHHSDRKSQDAEPKRHPDFDFP